MFFRRSVDKGSKVGSGGRGKCGVAKETILRFVFKRSKSDSSQLCKFCKYLVFLNFGFFIYIKNKATHNNSG